MVNHMQNSTTAGDSRLDKARKLHMGNWGTYAAAAGAALAMSTSASAEIVYSGETATASVAPGGGTKTAAFTVAGFNERVYVQNVVTHILGTRTGIGFVSDVVSHRPPPANLQFFAAQSKGDPVAKAYALGQMITGGDLSFGPGGLLRQNTTGNPNVGAFGPGTVTGFVGFKVSSGPLNGDLGWVQVKVSDAGSPGYPNEVQVLGWAYDDSGAAIAAGDVGTPEPGTAALGLLAFGVAGVLALRKRRNELAAK